MSEFFPHSCLFCKKYYPCNDKNNVMKGGGECWKWSTMKFNEESINKCLDYCTLEEKSIASRSMYAIRILCCNESPAILLSDLFLHSDMISLECTNVNDGIKRISGIINRIADYAEKCSESLADGIKLKKDKNTGKDMHNLIFDTRRRLNAFVKGFPRNLQFTYKFDGINDSDIIQIRVYNRNSIPCITLFSSERNEFLPLSDYPIDMIKRRVINKIRNEFAEYSNILRHLANQ